MSTISNIVRIISWIERIIIICILGLLFYLIQPIKTPQVITIKPGASAYLIISQLQSKGYDVGAIDRILLGRLGIAQSGEVRTPKTNMSHLELILRLSKPTAPIVKIRLLPGETKEIFLTQSAKLLQINPSKLLKKFSQISPYFDGTIKPETYYVNKGMSEERLIKFLLKGFEVRLKNLSKKAGINNGDIDWKKILTIASIIQKEAASTSEMKLISSVIYNRLEKKMALQMDGTLNYGNYSHTKVTPVRIKEDNSTFNTYRHKGLPKSPFCSLQDEAILAALKPATSDYLYFFLDRANHKHRFTKDFKSHKEAIKNLSRSK